MSLKIDIERIFGDSTSYANPGQAVNQASSLNALSGDLYTDSKRFIYELLQNADDSSKDSEAVTVWIKTFNKYLVVAHSGRPFSTRDLQGICNVNNGTKKSDPTKTGYKGIGFKSVFGQSEHVIIFTNNEYFRFDSSFQFMWNWDGTKEKWEHQNDREFQFPWQIIPIFTDTHEVFEPINEYLKDINANVATIIQLKNPEETRQAVLNLSQDLNMFLFLKNISKIYLDILVPISIEIDRTVQSRIILKQNGTIRDSWLVNTVSLSVPINLKASLQEERNIPEKLLSADAIELSLATKIGSEGIIKLTAQERLLYSYLPTDETRYSIPVLVNTSFLTTANRETLHADSKWNQWLFKNIAIEIFRWISELVSSEFQYQAYRLIPEKTVLDELGSEFNKGIKEAIETIPFILTNENELIKIEDTIVDFTFLSEKDFVGGAPVKSFINGEENKSSKKFAKNTGFGSDFKKLGASSFEWKDIPSFLTSKSFTRSHTIRQNIGLIKHLKSLCDSAKIREISTETLKKLPFVWDHRNLIKQPTQICFPTADDQNWNNPKNALSFLHQELQDWLLREHEMRIWLESLGMTEKTDISYITQTILPHIDTYITLENAIQPIQDLFILYRNGDLKEDLIKQLSKIKLLTQKGSLRSAKDCFLANSFSPRLEVEEILDADIFVHTSYCIKNIEKDEWKRFFKMLGVKEGFSTQILGEKHSEKELTDVGYNSEYFKADDKRFKPWINTFTADSYQNIITLDYVQMTERNSKFAIKFWSDVIENYSPDEIKLPATAFWGETGRPGRISGNEVDNYIPWFISNQECIPTVTGECKKSISVLLNTTEINFIAGKYLPVFEGPELTPDWKSFFNFRTSLGLSDYLNLLSKISLDVDDRGRIKGDNYKRVQSIYSILLNQCVNWSTHNISEVEEWANTGCLLNTKQQFKEANALKYFLDGTESVFQDQFDFLALSAECKYHPDLESFLTAFQVKILKQRDFELEHIHKELCSSLISHLKAIIPYFRVWVENEVNDDKASQYLENLQTKIAALNIYQAEELKIKYAGINFVKSVNIHFDETNLFVTNPWTANSVLLKLSEVLCRYFHLVGHDKKLDFLLRSTLDEIEKYLVQEGIDIPEIVTLVALKAKNDAYTPAAQANSPSLNSFEEIKNAVDEGRIIPEEFFHTSRVNYEALKYAEGLISRAVINVIEYLKILPEYDCTSYYMIAKSIIGGITKNGNDITVIARPSDNNAVLIYYTSEFDVLEYVDAEFWCEDGINIPKQITLGQLLKQTGINRIPIRSINNLEFDYETLQNQPKSEEFDFDPVPFAPQKIAKIVSSFANTSGGSLIFGLKETHPTLNEIVGLSTDFRIIDITKFAISLLSPIPSITYDWLKIGDKSIFVIKTEKANNDILLDNQKFIRKDGRTEAEVSISNVSKTLAVSKFNRTVAILIGIEDYLPKNQISPVKYANADLLKFREMLIDRVKVDERDIHVFQNGEALKSSLEYDLTGLFYYLNDDDRLIFYYVGHGFHNGITNYLSTYDMHKHHISETAVSLRKILLDPLRKSKCKNALIFIDACAQSFQDDNERSQIADINDEELKLLSNDFPYYATFLSCQPGQKSYSSDILENGIWTHHLVRAISGDVQNVIYKNKYITDRLLNDYLSITVASYTKDELGHDQNPRAILDSTVENIIAEIEFENIE